MNCSRCDDAMCDTHISGIGYICRECKEEFKKCLEVEHITVRTEDDIEKYLKVFIETEKGVYYKKDKEMTVDEFFNQHTK